MRLIALGLLLCTLCHAEELRLQRIEVECDGDKCTIERDVLLAVQATNMQLAVQNDELRERLRVLTEAKGCAKVEVLPKQTSPKTLAPGSSRS